MATTKAKQATNLKPKTSSTSPSSTPQTTPSSTHGRRSPKPGSPVDRQLPLLPQKPTPNYLKPKSTPIPSSSSSSSSKRLVPTRKPIEKPPSPSRQLTQRTPKTTPSSGSSKPVTRRSTGPLTRTRREEKEVLVQHTEDHTPKTLSTEEEMVKMELDPIDVAPIQDHVEKEPVEESAQPEETKEADQTEEVENIEDGSELESKAEATEEEEDKKEETTVQETETKAEVVVAKEEVVKKSVVVVGWKKEGPISNDVIEDAKSKLMEKRKSKVSALVGAFETVINLQKPEGQLGQQGGIDSGEAESQHGQREEETKESNEST